MFEKIPEPPIDPLYRVANAFKEDTRQLKVDLGVGVYKDAAGKASIMQCVRDAEFALADQNTTKAYLPQAGAPDFVAGMTRLLFADEQSPPLARIQTIGGTGGVRLALEAAKLANPNVSVVLGLPSWPNHAAICDVLGIRVRTFEHRNPESAFASLANAFAAVSQARRGDVLILHGPCHNPTGQDYSKQDLLEILSLAKAKGIIPLIDAAYYGLGNDLESDLKQLRWMLDFMPEAMLVMSCSKAFGLYRDRIGILFLSCRDEQVAQNCQAALQIVARTTYSGPAAHGAQVVGKILTDRDLESGWRSELGEMRERIAGLRQQIADLTPALPGFSHVALGKGIFTMLPLTPEDANRLQEEHAFFLPDSGRVNLAGFREEDIPRFIEAVKALK